MGDGLVYASSQNRLGLQAFSVRSAPLLLPLILLGVGAWRLHVLFKAICLQYHFTRHSLPHLKQLFQSNFDIGTFLVVALAGLPWSVFLYLRCTRGAAKIELVRAVTHALFIWLLIQAALFAGLLIVGYTSANALFISELAVFSIGCAVLAAWLLRQHSKVDSKVTWQVIGIYLLLALVLCVGGWVSVCFGQDYSFDLRNYHYYNAFAWVNHRLDLDFAVADRETFYNPTLDVPFYFAVQSMRPIWIGFLLGVLQSVPAVLLFALAFKVLGFVDSLATYRLSLALLCALTGTYDPVFFAELGTWFGDNLLTGLILAALLQLTELVPGMAAASANRRTPALWGGFLIGCAAGLKLTFASYGIAAGLSLLLLGGSWKQRSSAIGWYGVASLIGFLLTFGHWAVRLYMKTGNPVFPFFNGVFGSPYWFHDNMPLGFLHPVGWKQHIFYPIYFLWNQQKAMEVPFRDARLAIASVALFLGVVVCAARRLVKARGASTSQELASVKSPEPHVLAFLAIFCVSAYVVWLYKFFIIRYLYPVDMLAPLLILLLLAVVLGSSRRVLLSFTCICCFIVSWMQVETYGWHLKWTKNYFEAEMPTIKDTDDALVLMGWEGWLGKSRTNSFAHLVSLMPSQMRFIKIDSALTNPPLKMYKEVHELIENHQGPIYFMGFRYGIGKYDELFYRFGIRVNENDFQPIPCPYLDVVLWRAQRVTRVADSR